MWNLKSAAFLGAILGEYIGGVDRGVGPSLVNAQVTLNDDRAWGMALVCGLIAGVGYGIFAVLQRFVAPWASGSSGGGAGADEPRDSGRGTLGRPLAGAGS